MARQRTHTVFREWGVVNALIFTPGVNLRRLQRGIYYVTGSLGFFTTKYEQDLVNNPPDDNDIVIV